MNDRKLYLGVDLGGTNIAVGISDAGGNLSGKLSRPTPRGTGSIISAIAGACEQSLADAGLSVGDIDSLGVGVPGTIYPEGVVSYACNLGMKNVQLAKLLSERMGLPVFVENDGNCAAVGEYLVGCGRDGAYQPFCTPCGVCRQALAEFCAPDFKIFFGDDALACETHTLSELLPYAFSMGEPTG